LAETFEIQPLSSLSEGSSQNSPVRTGVKRQHKEYENTSILDVTLTKKKRQQPISGFLNAPSTTSTLMDIEFHLLTGNFMSLILVIKAD
jgi:hypothetical protein